MGDAMDATMDAQDRAAKIQAREDEALKASKTADITREIIELVRDLSRKAGLLQIERDNALDLLRKSEEAGCGRLCYGERDHSRCYGCIHSASDIDDDEKRVDKFISQRDATDELFQFLKGEKLPEGYYCKMPRLKPNMAFTVIWFLQEHMHCLPDNIETCQACNELFDSHSEGYSLSDDYELNGKTLPKKYWGHWCDNCGPDVEFELK